MATAQSNPKNCIPPIVTEHIVMTPGICGGKPRINGHRVKVQHIAVWHERMGLSADAIVQDHPELSLANVYAALTYYFDHREEIDRDIHTDREFADKLRESTPSLLDKVRNPDAANDPLPS